MEREREIERCIVLFVIRLLMNIYTLVSLSLSPSRSRWLEVEVRKYWPLPGGGGYWLWLIQLFRFELVGLTSIDWHTPCTLKGVHVCFVSDGVKWSYNAASVRVSGPSELFSFCLLDQKKTPLQSAKLLRGISALTVVGAFILPCTWRRRWKFHWKENSSGCHCHDNFARMLDFLWIVSRRI